MERICIYPKDIQIVTGRSERYGRDLIKKIKSKLGKEDHQMVSVHEFCQYLGLQFDAVIERLKVYN